MDRFSRCPKWRPAGKLPVNIDILTYLAGPEIGYTDPPIFLIAEVTKPAMRGEIWGRILRILIYRE
jgi:hypothetical protein